MNMASNRIQPLAVLTANRKGQFQLKGLTFGFYRFNYRNVIKLSVSSLIEGVAILNFEPDNSNV